MSIKVLVADDSITIQKVIGIIFGGDEYSLTVVDNGKAAVEKALDINPDILLIDALMPGMSGYEVVEMVRSTPSLAHKPILILTGSFEPFDEEKAKNCGADDFISKPFESQQIITKVEELLKLGSSRALPPSHPAPAETDSEQAPEVSAPIFDIFTEIIDQQPEIPQPAAPADIWGAFTTEVEPRGEAATAPVVAHHSALSVEPEIFSIVTEENDAQLVQTIMPSEIQNKQTGSKWVPVEESTFEFKEETVAEPPRSAVFEQKGPAQDTSFGDIAFEDEEITPALPSFSAVSEPNFANFTNPSPVIEKPPVFDETTAFESVSVSEMATPPVTPPPVNLTEEQLKAAITAASKEVIERIVWEVVPDLAEAMIREAIRKIKEGV